MAPRRKPEVREPAAVDPVARLVVDVALAHLDRPFDYLVPAALSDAVVPGSRVRVRFSGQLVDATVLERVPATSHEGRLAFIERSISAEPVLTPQIAQLARAVADHWGGTMIDVLRLAIPPRHARVEAEPAGVRAPAPAAPDPTGWSAYRTGAAFLRALADGRSPRAVWTALPGEDWPARIAEAVQATVSGGRGALVVVPDRRDLARVDAALTTALGAGRHVSLSADLGPAQRYRSWLRIRRGDIGAVVGTRAAAYAPVADLGLVVVWDDGDDLYAEPRAPYPHTRDVLVHRAHLGDTAALLGAAARSTDAATLIGTGWARELVAERSVVRARAPRVVPVGDDEQVARDPGARSARLPSVAWRAAGDALRAGAPVLVQVPRRGYVPALACAHCRASARCPACAGPLGQSSGVSAAVPACRWCARPAGNWTCPSCGGTTLRAAIVGARRTAEELGRAFPGVAVRTSGRDAVLDRVPATAAIVVATPGAEPVADGGYGAALLLDGWALLTRIELRAGEEALRRWMNAATLVRPGGVVVLGADAGVPVAQALIRWEPGWLATRELAERAELGFPPVTRFASITGLPSAVADLRDVARLPASAEKLGPVPADDDRVRLLIRVPRAEGGSLARALHDALAVRSARKAPDPVRVQLDPLELL